MKKLLNTKFIFVTLIFIFLFSSICMASDVAPISSNETTETSNDVDFIASDVYKLEEDVKIDQIIDGNAFAFGNNVSVSGEIGGDLFVFGGNVTIEDTAYIHGSIFAFSKNLELNGICYDVYCASETFTLGKDAIVARDVRIGADKVHINGKIKRDAYLSTNELIFAENTSNAIMGNLNYSSSSEFVISDEVVGGKINFTKTINEETPIYEKILSTISSMISKLLYALVIILLIIWLAPKFKDSVAEIFAKKAPLSLGVGILASIVIIVSTIALMFITFGLGINISIALAILYVLILTISKTIFSIGLAKLINNKVKQDNTIMLILISLLICLVINLIQLIPFVGGFVGFITSMIGFGVFVLHLFLKKTNTVTNA